MFPPLLNSGGYELLHCIPNTKDLAVIPVTTSNPITNLQLNTGKGTIYIRPIQENLHTSEDYEDIEEEVSKLQSQVYISTHSSHLLMMIGMDHFYVI